MTVTKPIGEGFGKGELYDVLKWFNNMPVDATITVGATHTNTIAAAIQLKDYLGNDVAVSCSVIAYLSSDSAGLDAATVAPTTDLASGTDGECEILLASHVYLLTSEVDGDIDVSLGYTTGAHDFFLVLVLPTGKKIVSTKFEFSA